MLFVAAARSGVYRCRSPHVHVACTVAKGELQRVMKAKDIQARVAAFTGICVWFTMACLNKHGRAHRQGAVVLGIHGRIVVGGKLVCLLISRRGVPNV